jgi:glycosyltransferase involved in cell wall biosynthesis
LRVGYVVKRYPSYSETFVVNEILAHEAAGLALDLFSLRAPLDGHFQEALGRVRAQVTYVPPPTPGALKASHFWQALVRAGEDVPGLWARMGEAREEEFVDVYQGVLLACEVRRKRLGHLHAHFAGEATTVARLAAHFAGIPYTFTAHAKDIFHTDVRPEGLRRNLRDAAAVVTVSDYNRAPLQALDASAAPRVRRVYNGLDLGQFPYQEPRHRPPRVVAVGRLIEKKGFEDLVEACALLAGRDREFACQIIGAGPLEAALRGQVERRGLRARVELLGPRPQGEVVRSVQGAAAFALPCVVGADGDRDGLPTVLLEAMALGTPCVSTDVTGIPEVVKHGETGLVVPQHDPAALAAALEELLGDPPLRVRLAGRARRLIEAAFDIDRNAACLREIFQAPGGRESDRTRANMRSCRYEVQDK